jgi:hypothetical protein
MVLNLGFERAVKRMDVDRGVGDLFAQPRLRAPDFRLARQERENRSGVAPQCPLYGLRNLHVDRL